MKRILISLFFLFVLFSMPVMAYDWIPPDSNIQWPPEPYDMPQIAYDPEVLEIVSDGMKVSSKAVSAVGLRVMIYIICLTSIGVIFQYFVIRPLQFKLDIARRGYNRRVKAADIQQNREDILSEKIADIELGADAKHMYRIGSRDKLVAYRLREMDDENQVRQVWKDTHKGSLISQKVADMKMSAEAKKIFDNENFSEPDDIAKRLHGIEINQAAKKQFEELHYNEGEDIAKRLHGIEMNDQARRLFNEAHYDEDEEIDKQVQHMEVNLKARRKFHMRNFNAELEERMYAHALSSAASEEIKKDLNFMNINKKSKETNYYGYAAAYYSDRDDMNSKFDYRNEDVYSTLDMRPPISKKASKK